MQKTKEVLRVFVSITKKEEEDTNVVTPLGKRVQCHHKRQYRNQSVLMEGAGSSPRTYKNFRYKFSIYKSRSEELESLQFK